MLLCYTIMQRKIWTKKGLAVLGSIIRRCREARGLTLRDFSNSCKPVHFKTISCIENSTVIPNFNTLEAIAASGLVSYNGKTLDIYDFIDIASESYTEDNADLPLFKDLELFEVD